MKIAFIWYFDKASQVYDNWRDGLRAAMEVIGKDHQVDWYLDKQIPTEKYDFYLVWDDSNTEAPSKLPKESKKGLCLTTDPHNIPNLMQFDVVYCESDPIYEKVRSSGIRAIKAFGTDTDFFSPDDSKKDIEYFYPATFSPWKRQSEIAYLGDKLFCVGTLQPDGVSELTECTRNGVRVKNDYVPVSEIRGYYRRTQKIIIPAVHGSERTVLEAMSCGIIPEVTHSENVRTSSYIKELKESGLSPREFVIKNYSHIVYAKNILKGICE